MIICDNEKKYCVFGGYVRSNQDKDIHYVSGRELIKLYGLNQKECAIAPAEKLFWKMPKDLIALGVRADGNYTLPRVENDNS